MPRRILRQLNLKQINYRSILLIPCAVLFARLVSYSNAPSSLPALNCTCSYSIRTNYLIILNCFSSNSNTINSLLRLSHGNLSLISRSSCIEDRFVVVWVSIQILFYAKTYFLNKTDGVFIFRITKKISLLLLYTEDSTSISGLCDSQYVTGTCRSVISTIA